MAKGGGIGKLGKLKCMIKRWQAASASHRRLSQPTGGAASIGGEGNQQLHGGNGGGELKAAAAPSSGLRAVFVGKSRRRYLISTHVVEHPLFRVLVERSGGAAEDGGDGAGGSTAVVGCEVVLFEHLLWMLENADDPHEPSSVDELAEFYAC